MNITFLGGAPLRAASMQLSTLFVSDGFSAATPNSLELLPHRLRFSSYNHHGLLQAAGMFFRRARHGGCVVGKRREIPPRRNETGRPKAARFVTVSPNPTRGRQTLSR
jgi:hypothetical protein